MTTPATAANTISSVIPFLTGIAGAVETQTRASPDVIAKVQLALQGVQQGTAALAQSETAAQSQPIVQRIEADAMAVLSTAATLPLPAPWNMILLFAAPLLQAAVSAVNILLATKTTLPANDNVPAAA
jgi:hypothetical protein